MHIVKENGDGTVTIDRKVYEELHRRACAERTDWIPLTPNIRAAVNEGIGRNLEALKTCSDTPWVNLSRIANESLRCVINGLPDGYPMPITRK